MALEAFVGIGFTEDTISIPFGEQPCKEIEKSQIINCGTRTLKEARRFSTIGIGYPIGKPLATDYHQVSDNRASTGAGYQSRTDDLLITNQLLYH